MKRNVTMIYMCNLNVLLCCISRNPNRFFDIKGHRDIDQTFIVVPLMMAMIFNIIACIFAGTL